MDERYNNSLNSKKLYKINVYLEELFKNEYLKCTKCANGVVKPDIVFFGEVSFSLFSMNYKLFKLKYYFFRYYPKIFFLKLMRILINVIY